jgi:hypothetical protein
MVYHQAVRHVSLLSFGEVGVVVVCLGFLLHESVVVIHDEIRGEYVLSDHEQAGAVEVYEMSCFESFWRCQRYYIVLPSQSLYRVALFNSISRTTFSREIILPPPLPHLFFSIVKVPCGLWDT